MVLVGCTVVFLLPETIHRTLPHTIREIEEWTILVGTIEGIKKTNDKENMKKEEKNWWRKAMGIN